MLNNSIQEFDIPEELYINADVAIKGLWQLLRSEQSTSILMYKKEKLFSLPMSVNELDLVIDLNIDAVDLPRVEKIARKGFSLFVVTNVDIDLVTALFLNLGYSRNHISEEELLEAADEELLHQLRSKLNKLCCSSHIITFAHDCYPVYLVKTGW